MRWGLSLGEYKGHSLLEHSGFWVGYTSHFIRFADLKLKIAVAANYNEIDSEEIAEFVLASSLEIK